VFQESQPWKPLQRLAELGVLGQISPVLVWNGWLEARVMKYPADVVRWQKQSPDDQVAAGGGCPSLVMTYLALVSMKVEEEDIATLGARLKLPKDETEFLMEVNRLTRRLASLAEPGLSRSAIYRLLAPFAAEVIFVCWQAAEQSLLSKRLELFHNELRKVTPLLDGNRLRSMGLPPGPLYTKVLGALRDAKLDGKVETLHDEEETARQLIADGASVNTTND
jgi:tRNA nucleotidyltransferase (CCA-adding enzyme)